jgi:hypothetical protein
MESACLQFFYEVCQTGYMPLKFGCHGANLFHFMGIATGGHAHTQQPT